MQILKECDILKSKTLLLGGCMKKKWIALLLGIAVIAGASAYAYTQLKGDDGFTPGVNTPTEPGIGFTPGVNTPTKPGIVITEQLETPQDLSYDEGDYMLTWDSVDNASGYTIYYNGNEFEVDANDTKEKIVVTAQDNTFKVKANGDQVDYTDSEWSEEYTYTIEQEQQQSIFNKVNLAIGECAEQEGYEIIDIIGISYSDIEGTALGDQVYIECLCEENNTIKNVTFAIETTINTSIGEVLSDFSMDEIRQQAKVSAVDYDSASYLIKSESYDGNMQQLKNEGYEISVVNSCTRKGKAVGSKFRFEIVGTYKAVRGNEVLYFTSINRIDVTEPAFEERVNYEELLRYVKYRDVKETSFVLHESGQTWEYMEDWVKANDVSLS